MSKWKTIVDVPLCEPCVMDGSKCSLVTLMERGFIPGAKIKVLKELNGNKIVKIKNGANGLWKTDYTIKSKQNKNKAYNKSSHGEHYE